MTKEAVMETPKVKNVACKIVAERGYKGDIINQRIVGAGYDVGVHEFRDCTPALAIPLPVVEAWRKSAALGPELTRQRDEAVKLLREAIDIGGHIPPGSSMDRRIVAFLAAIKENANAAH